MTATSVVIDLSVDQAMNPDVLWKQFGEKLSPALADSAEGKDIIPLLDESGRVKAIAHGKATGFIVSDREISENSPSFLIAEIGNNHNGDLLLAKRLVRLAVDAGADCVKFQMRDMESLYKNNQSNSVQQILGPSTR